MENGLQNGISTNHDKADILKGRILDRFALWRKSGLTMWENTRVRPAPQQGYPCFARPVLPDLDRDQVLHRHRGRRPWHALMHGVDVPWGHESSDGKLRFAATENFVRPSSITDVDERARAEVGIVQLLASSARDQLHLGERARAIEMVPVPVLHYWPSSTMQLSAFFPVEGRGNRVVATSKITKGTRIHAELSFVTLPSLDDAPNPQALSELVLQ
ncbi:hypothetical protein PG987_010796 [Apiospora arundinis]